MKIAIIQKDKETAVSYYRTNVPFAELSRTHGHEIRIIEPKNLSNDALHYFDVVVFHRPESDIELRLMWLCHVAGVKTWVDIDDLLWKIPSSNPASMMFTPTSKTNLQRAFLNADIVTCSTPQLSKEIDQEFGVEAFVIPNAYNDRQPLSVEFNTERDEALLLYRGSNTHDGDLYQHRDAFKQLPNVQYNFMGLQPWYMLTRYGGNLDRLFMHPYKQSVLDYFAVIMNMNPSFFIFPLEDNTFNVCKSNIAAIEATMAGALMIAPAYMPEFSKVDGVLLYDNVFHLAEIIETISIDYHAGNRKVQELEIYRKLFNRQRDWVKKNCALSDANNKRNQLLSVII
jgi:hypothetical protein